MKFKTKYRLMLWKGYLDAGVGLTSYVKYAVVVVAVKSLSLKGSFWAMAGYGVFCFLLGWAYFSWGFRKAETEVQNQYNIFVNQVRQKLKRRKVL